MFSILSDLWRGLGGGGWEAFEVNAPQAQKLQKIPGGIGLINPCIFFPHFSILGARVASFSRLFWTCTYVCCVRFFASQCCKILKTAHF